MDLKEAFGLALKKVRTHRGLSQEDFSVISSRTYLSTLERGIKSPTLDKIGSIAGKLDVHPVTLLVLAYMQDENFESLDEFLKKISDEVTELSEDVDQRHN